MRYVDEISEAFRNQLALAYRAKDLLAYGLRSRLREGYTRKDLRADFLAALVVAGVALPLSLALASAAGVPPQHGLYTAIIAGVIGALLGGTRFQVSGPTAAFVVILVPIGHQFELAGVLVAGLMAGGILVLMGLARMGRLLQFVPHPVTTGFTMGIAVVIALFQLRDVFGLQTCSPSVAMPCMARTEGSIDYLQALWQARAGIHLWDLGIAVVAFGLLLALPRIIKRVPVPVPLIVVVLMAAVVAIAAHVIPGFDAVTLGSKFTATVGGEVVRGIPPLPPLPGVPWHETPGFTLDYATIRALIPSAFAIAMLGALESLTSASAADGMSGTRHEPNSELIALGIANIVCPFFGGIAASGALARTATNIRAGARSPIAAALQAIILLACAIALAPLVAYLPIAALAALVVVVAINMSEGRHFVRLTRVAPRHDVLVMLTCFALTVVFDMVIAVTVGIVLAALLFMRRMSFLTKVNLETPTDHGIEVPAGVRLFQIAGPLFFGAAKTAMEALHTFGSKQADHTYIINMEHVPTIDATGLVAIESVLDRLHRSSIKVIFAGMTPEVAEIFDRAGIKKRPGQLAYAPNVSTALSMAIVHAARGPRFARASTPTIS
ncbi:MAG: STAS domain-containing protein [Deltaproteobacteria bacterium]|nr:STAS domain-containing protein [Deltaproteobacteria bacterium]